MRFARHQKIFRGQLDAAPLAGVLFLLVLFLLLASLIYTPGVQIKLPVAGDLPGVDGPVVTVAVDVAGKFYFDNQMVAENKLSAKLAVAAKKISPPPTLIVQADKAMPSETLLHLTLLARDAGITNASWATLPRSLGKNSTDPRP